MRYMSLFRPAVTEDRMSPPSPELMTAMGQLIESETRSGVLVSTGGLLSSAHGARVRHANGDITVTDGPFTETKELVAGYAILQVRSKAEAVESAKRFVRIVGEGVCEVRPFFGPGFVAREGTQLYMSLWRPTLDESKWGPPSGEEMAKMQKLVDEETKAGILVSMGGLLPSKNGVRMASTSGKLTIVDGPFTEAKELIAGFGVFEVKSGAEAIAAAKRFLAVAGDGECEVRPMYGASEPTCVE